MGRSVIAPTPNVSWNYDSVLHPLPRAACDLHISLCIIVTVDRIQK